MTESAAMTPSVVRRGRVLVGLMLATSLAALDATVVATAVPAIVGDLGGFSAFPWVFSAYVLATAVTTPVYGKLADLYGRRPMLVFGTAVFLLGSVLCGCAWSMPALVLARAVQGLGAGALQGISQTVIADLYDIRERGRISGWMSSVWGVSAVVGPALGGLFSQYGSWRLIFFVNLPFGLAAVGMVVRYLKETVVPKRHAIDVAGAVLLVAWTGALVLALLSGGTRWPWVSWQSGLALAVCLVALVAFLVRESRASDPMLPPWVLRYRVTVGSNLASLCVGLTVSGLTTFLPTFAQTVLGATPVVAGFVLAAMSVGWPFAATMSARLYMRIGFRDTALVGTLLLLVGAALFATLRMQSSLWHIAAGSLVVGLGLGLVSNATMVGVQSIVGWARRGVVTGSMMFTRTIGTALGAAVLGGVANATLTGWLGHAPASLRDDLPRSVDDATKVVQAADTSPAVVAFLREGMYLSVHRVLWGVGVVAVVALVVLLATPRWFRPLDPEDRTTSE